MPNGWSSLFEPLTNAPSRLAKKISGAMEPYEPMQQTGEGGIQDWLGWTDAAAKGLLQGSTEAAGNVISDMTSPFSLGMSAMGGQGIKQLGQLARLGKNAANIGKSAPTTLGRLPAEFAPIGSEATVNAGRAANMAQEATNLANVSKQGNVGKKNIAPDDWGDWGGAEKSMPHLELDDIGSTVARKTDIGHSRPETLSKPLPQIDEAYRQGPPNAAGINLGSAGTSVYEPAVSKEMGRLMVEMLDEGTAKDAFKIAQDKYPRLMGHVDQIKIGPQEGSRFFDRLSSGGSSGGVNSGWPGSSSVSTIRVDPMAQMNWSPKGMANTIGHELAHSAQRLRKGNTKFNTMYGEAERSIGYRNNPFEKQANKSGKKFSNYATRRSE